MQDVRLGVRPTTIFGKGFCMSFRDKTWEQRINDPMFYHSEKIFERIWPGPFEHFGLGVGANEMAVYKMPPFLLHAPDYIAAQTPESTPVLVEVQGCGKAGKEHRFKQKKLDALGKWNSIHEVTFWLWSDADETFVWTSYVSIRGMIQQGHATQGLFDGKRPYWSIPVDVIEKLADTERIYAKYS